MTKKYVYFFGPHGTEGDATMKNSLGGKGANLAEMAKLGPAGSRRLYDQRPRILRPCSSPKRPGQFPESLREGSGRRPARRRKRSMGMKFGDAEQPLLLLSCRSGARTSMPGMMETVLNVGLCHEDDPRPDQEERATSVSCTTPTAG